MNKNGDHAKAGGPITAYRQWRRRAVAFFLMLALFCDSAAVKAAGKEIPDGKARTQEETESIIAQTAETAETSEDEGNGRKETADSSREETGEETEDGSREETGETEDGSREETGETEDSSREVAGETEDNVREEIEEAEEKGTEGLSWNIGAGVAALIDYPEETVSEEEPSEEEEASVEKAGELVMADVQNVLNVRREPDGEAEIIGYLYADCGGTVLEQKDGWTKLESGNLTGWASDDYLLFGKDAEKAAQDAGRVVATTTTGALRIRKEPSLEAGIYDLLEEGAEYEVVDSDQLAFSDGIEISDEWVAVDYEGKTGFVSSEFVKVDFVLDHGETVEEIERRKEEERRAAEEQKAKEQARKQAIEKAMSYNASDETLLAALIQCEAGSDVYEGQVAVGAVVMNRVLSSAYPNTIRDVIFASGQFTPAGSGKLGRVIDSGNIWASCIQEAQILPESITLPSLPLPAGVNWPEAKITSRMVLG